MPPRCGAFSDSTQHCHESEDHTGVTSQRIILGNAVVSGTPTWTFLHLRKISSAVSTSLREHELAVGYAGSAERCGYGDLQ